MRGTAYGGAAHFGFSPSRKVIGEYADLLESPTLRALADSDVFWDRVVSVTPSGREKVYDLTVPGPASWLADGIVSHNSGAIEQDADVVIFPYREEFYLRRDKPDERDQEATTAWHRSLALCSGKIDLIVAKQRMGETGAARALFDERTNWLQDCPTVAVGRPVEAEGFA
jgi:replicative DNA helicase